MFIISAKITDKSGQYGEINKVIKQEEIVATTQEIMDMVIKFNATLHQITISSEKWIIGERK